MTVSPSADGRLLGAIARLIHVLDSENEGLARPDFDIKTSNVGKSRCLYEMTMLLRGVEIEDLSPEAAAGLRQVKDKLALNAERVKAHLDAVRAVTDLLKDAMQAAEADGTYSREQFGYPC